ncbi:MAG TPA: DUF4845 domain-containing protein [Burkholderiales bacterium]|nr:DUF4845 domain-containing protein [Burkholderiales bacterium]
MHRQRGLSLSGFVLWSIAVIFAGALALKIGPAYFEYATINKQLKATVADPGTRGGARKDVENAFMNRQMVSDIKSINYKDLVITKEGDGYSLSVDYTVCVPIVSNLRACMDFSASSNK